MFWTILKKIWIRMRVSTQRVVHFIMFRRKTFRQCKQDIAKKTAVIHFDDVLMNSSKGRYSYFTASLFEYFGFQVIIKTNYKYFKKIEPFKKLLLSKSFSFCRNIPTPVNTITLTGWTEAPKTIRLFYDYHVEKNAAFDFVMPYPMHPNQYTLTNLKSIPNLRKTKRKVRVFFGGRFEKRRYNKQSLIRDFKVIPRFEVINFIKENFASGSDLTVMRESVILNKFLYDEDFSAGILISEIGTGDWFKALSTTDFFICPPGVNIPWSHNAIEAMSVGTIPILQYSSLFHPNLRDSVNCLVYDDLRTLKKVLLRALSMEPQEVEQLRSEVLDYFDEFLSIESLEKKMEQFGKSDKQEVRVAIPYIQAPSSFH